MTNPSICEVCKFYGFDKCWNWKHCLNRVQHPLRTESDTEKAAREKVLAKYPQAATVEWRGRRAVVDKSRNGWPILPGPWLTDTAVSSKDGLAWILAAEGVDAVNKVSQPLPSTPTAQENSAYKYDVEIEPSRVAAVNDAVARWKICPDCKAGSVDGRHHDKDCKASAPAGKQELPAPGEFTFIAADGTRVTIDIEAARRQYGRHLKEIATLKEALTWALGETDEFRGREANDGPYWWRKELRLRMKGK